METHTFGQVEFNAFRERDIHGKPYENDFMVSLRETSVHKQMVSLTEQDIQLMFCIAFPQYIPSVLHRTEPPAREYEVGDFLLISKRDVGGYNFARIISIKKTEKLVVASLQHLSFNYNESNGVTFRPETILHPVYRAKDLPAKL